MHHVGTDGHRPTVKGIHVVDMKVGDVVVIADLRGWGNIWTATEHEDGVACSTEPPVPGFNVIELAAENVPIPSAGQLQVMDRQHRT